MEETPRAKEWLAITKRHLARTGYLNHADLKSLLEVDTEGDYRVVLHEDSQEVLSTLAHRDAAFLWWALIAHPQTQLRSEHEPGTLLCGVTTQEEEDRPRGDAVP